MDRHARDLLISEIAKQKTVGGEIAVPLDLFFAGNNDKGSIGCNLGDSQPPIQEFYRTFQLLRERREVQDIWVRISDAEDVDSWPYTDTVYVISSLPRGEIEMAVRDLGFDEVSAEWMYGKPRSAPEPLPGFTPYSVWWD